MQKVKEINMLNTNKPFSNADYSEYEASRSVAICIQYSMDCQSICLETLNYCLTMSDNYPVRPILDCIEVCQINANFMLRGSRLRKNIAELCISACEKCEEFCSQFKDDMQMRACAEACRKCIESCEQAIHAQSETFLS